MVFCENKIDLIDETKLDHALVEQLTKQYKLRLYRTSVVENYNIADAFNYLLQKAKAKFPDPTGAMKRKESKHDNDLIPAIRRTNGQKPVFNRYGKCIVM